MRVEIPDSSEIDPAPIPVSVAAYESIIVAATKLLLFAEESPIVTVASSAVAPTFSVPVKSSTAKSSLPVIVRVLIGSKAEVSEAKSVFPVTTKLPEVATAAAFPFAVFNSAVITKDSRSVFEVTAIDLVVPAIASETKSSAPETVTDSDIAVKVMSFSFVLPDNVTSPKVPSIITVSKPVWPVTSKSGVVVTAVAPVWTVGVAPITWRYSKSFVPVMVNPLVKLGITAFVTPSRVIVPSWSAPPVTVATSVALISPSVIKEKSKLEAPSTVRSKVLSSPLASTEAKTGIRRVPPSSIFSVKAAP